MTQTIRAVQPDVVVVELCQYRVSMLKMDEVTLLKEAKDINLEKVQQAIKQVCPLLVVNETMKIVIWLVI